MLLNIRKKEEVGREKKEKKRKKEEKKGIKRKRLSNGRTDGWIECWTDGGSKPLMELHIVITNLERGSQTNLQIVYLLEIFALS